MLESMAMLQSKNSRRLACSLLMMLSVATLALFWPAIGYDYVKLDDDQYIANNPRVQSGLSIPNVRWAFTTVHEDWWLPGLWISYMADRAVFGPGPFGHHLVNVLFHAVNAGLVFWFLYRLTGFRWRSLFAAALFAFHPLRVESVAWLTARKDVLSAFFFLIALLAYLHYVRRPTAGRMGWVGGLMLLGLMSKAIVIVLPCTLLLLDYWPLRRAGGPGEPGAWRAWRPLLVEKTLLLSLALVFVIINLHTHRSQELPSGTAPVWLLRLALVFPNYWAYLAKIFWPVRLAILYPEHDVVRWPVSALAALGLLALTAMFAAGRRRAPYAMVGWLWFLVCLLPVIRGVRLGLGAYADRFTYLPFIGLALAIVWGVSDLAAGFSGRGTRLAVFAGGLALVASAALTRTYLPRWQNSLVMYSYLVQREPGCELALAGHGAALLEAGHTEESLVPSALAAARNPVSLGVLNYAEALLRLGRFHEIAPWLEAARQNGFPETASFHALAGFAELGADRAAEAIPHLHRALELESDQLAWRVELVRACLEAGHPTDAARELHVLNAAGISGLQDLGGLAAYYAVRSTGNPVYVWRFFENNLRRNPDDVLLLNNAAWFLATRPRPPAPPAEALRLALHAVALGPPDNPSLLDTLAAAYAINGRFDNACATAEKAVSLARQQEDLGLSAEIAKRLQAYRAGQVWLAD